MQIRQASGFNKYPPKAIKPLGLGGNTMLLAGFTFAVVSIAMVSLHLILEGVVRYIYYAYVYIIYKFFSIYSYRLPLM